MIKRTTNWESSKRAQVLRFVVRGHFLHSPIAYVNCASWGLLKTEATHVTQHTRNASWFRQSLFHCKYIPALHKSKTSKEKIKTKKKSSGKENKIIALTQYISEKKKLRRIGKESRTSCCDIIFDVSHSLVRGMSRQNFCLTRHTKRVAKQHRLDFSSKRLFS